MKDGFSEFVKVTQDPANGETLVSGYCIDIFKTVLRELPYAVPYKFVPFAKLNGETARSYYNDLIDQVYYQASSSFTILNIY